MVSGLVAGASGFGCADESAHPRPHARTGRRVPSSTVETCLLKSHEIYGVNDERGLAANLMLRRRRA